MIGWLRRAPREVERHEREYSLDHRWTCPKCGAENWHTFTYHARARVAICGIVCNACGVLVPQAVSLGALPHA